MNQYRDTNINSIFLFAFLKKKIRDKQQLAFILSTMFAILFCLSGLSQTISYITPDIGTSNHSTYVEILGPYNQNNNFGVDGIYLNNPGDVVRVVCANNADTNKIKIGPALVSWNGKLISTQIFVMPGITSNSTNWQLLTPAFKIPIQVVLNGTNFSNADTFYIVQPQPAITASGAGVLGSGGSWGIRSRRGAMIFDSLIFQNGAVISASTADSDPVTPGNQGFLPVHVISLGRIFIDNGATVSLSAPGGQNTDGGPGGGGGGTESFTNCSPGAGGTNHSGEGFTGGGTELLRGEQPGGGTGSTPPPCAMPGNGGISLNGVPGGVGWLNCNVDEGGGGGGTGHPFGTSGGKDGQPGGYGGGAGYSGYGGGGYASDGTTPSVNENGKANGNSQIIPFAGGSAGGAGVAGSGTSRGGGGGGGGAITLHAYLSSILKQSGNIDANGGAGVIGCGGYRGGGGGSGGAIAFTGKLSSQGNGTIAVNGGPGGVGGGGAGGQGGAGRARVDGPFTTFPNITPVPGTNSSSNYNGPSTDTTSFVARAFNLTGTGNGQPIRIYLKPVTKPWQLVATITGYGTSWVQNIILPCPDTSFLLVAAQQVPSPSTLQYTAEPEWTFSQSATNLLIVKNALKAHAGIDTSVCPSSCLTLGSSPSSTGGILPYTYSWQPTIGLDSPTTANPTVCLFNTTKYTLTVTDSSGCSYSDTVNVSAYPKPIANYGFDDICLTDTVEFTDSSIVTTGSVTGWEWNFGDGSATATIQHPKHKYISAGSYTVTLIATTNNGCKDTVSKTIVVHALPVAQFTAAANVCHGKYAVFTEASSISNTDTIQSWQWDFDDGTPLLTQQNVTGGHLYSATGTYNVQLVTTSTFGCVDTITKILFVRPKPTASFGSTKVCDGTNTVFSDSSTTTTGSVNVWIWDFADGSSTNLTQNPSHLFADAGIHTVTLIVQNTFGCADTVTKPVQVYFNPIANFTVQDVCLNYSVFFIDSSYVDVSATIASYLWVFGDGSPTSSLKNPGHFYSSQGIYNATLLSTTNQGCSNTTSKTVQVFDPPTSNFTVADVCLFDSALFSNSSANPTMGTIASWLWNFGDGNTNNNTYNPNHLYTATGTYTVSLISRSSNLACADTLIDSIAVFPMPVANFSASDVCLEQAVNFNDSSYVANNNSITTWNWAFGDGGTSTLQNPNHTYSAFGEYSVFLIATTDHGCKDTVNHDIVIHPLPTANFGTTNICLEDTSIFINQSEIPANITNDAIFSWNWDFADNTPAATTPNTSHLYTSIGSYTVELKIISDFGCPDSITRTIIINPNPQVIFSTDDTLGCEPLCINVTDASIVVPGTNAAWTWDLGDGTIVNGTNVYHCYNTDSVFTPEQFPVTLTVTSDSGCVSSITKNNYITVYPEPISSFNVSPVSATITYPVITITNLSTGANFWNWNFGNSDTSSFQNPSEQTYADTGSYTIQLITKTLYNCADTSYQTIVIEPDFMFYVPNAFTPNDDGINDTFIGKGMFINEFEMLIFDRWGNLVYKTTDINKPWNGKVNSGNESAQMDVYIYLIKVSDFKTTKYTYRGTVTLVK